MKTMSLEDWKLKRENDKLVSEYLEETRQKIFAEEQSKESVFTREIQSIVDCDN